MELLKANMVDCREYQILALAGEIDASVRDMLLCRILGLVDDDARPLIVDMAGVWFCDATGLAVAVQAQRHAAVRGRVLAFCGLNEPIGRIFHLTGIAESITIYRTMTDAALALKQPPHPVLQASYPITTRPATPSSWPWWR